LDEYKEIEIDRIEWKDPVRSEITKEDIQAMATSFMTHAQIEPIVVKPMNEHGKYEGVIGRLRYEATKYGNRKTVEARIHYFRDKSEVKSWQLAENLHRVNLSVVQKAEAWAELYERIKKEVPGTKTDEPIVEAMACSVHEMTGIEPAKKTIRENLRIASKLGNKAKNLLRGQKKFGSHSANALLKIENEDDQAEIAKRAIDGRWTDSRTKKEVDDYFKVEESATEKVKEILDKGDLTLQHAAEIARLNEEVQEKLTDVVVSGGLKPSEVKKVADFVETYPEEVTPLFNNTPEQIVKIAEGKEVLKTAEDVEKFFRGKKGQATVEEFACPGCGRKLEVNWFKGEISWSS